MTAAPSTPLKIGTRGSTLALAQTGMIAERVAKVSPFPVEIIPITTTGDTSRESLSSLGGTGVFASALRDALIAGECDMVVHSIKDLPTEPFPGLRVEAIPKRADARDVLVAQPGMTLTGLASGATVGTGSPRRAAQVRAARPDLQVVDIRGNVETRMRMVNDGTLDAVILAAAGLGRIGRLDAVTEFFELSAWPTAPGQGALAIEVRDPVADGVKRILRTLEHASSRLMASAERAVLARLEAGCAAPVGATAVIDTDLLLVTATVWRPDGASSLTSSHAGVLEGSAADRATLAEELGWRVADELLKLGAAELAPLR